MQYQATLDYMYQQLPMYQRIGAAAYKKDLTNTLALMERLGNPERSFRAIHIAGTNGKGSVSHFLAAILQAAGYKVGLYTSPHYVDFRERIKINGALLPKRKVVEFIAQHKTYLEELQPSFFEMTVGLAFDHFRDEQVDFAVIETGLGGRLDSTNVVTPVLSVITNISYDHMAMLGATLPLIAVEKAGIIKPGIPVVVGERQDEVWSVFEEKARACGAPLICAQDVCTVQKRDDLAMPQRSVFDLCLALPEQEKSEQNKPVFDLSALELDVAGPYQSKNLVTAMTAIGLMNESVFAEGDIKITETHVRTALADVRSRVRFMGRWQYIADNILCDSAHNEAGLKLLFGAVRTMTFERLHIVCGFANDKDLAGILPLFPTDATYYFAKANVPRGLAAASLRDQAAVFGLHGKAYQSVNRAVAASRAVATKTDLVLITGSIFVLGEVLALLQKRQK